MAKIMVSIDDNLLARIDNYADNNYMSRSGLLTLSVNNYLNSVEAISVIKEMGLTLRKIADNGNIDHETMERLEDFERFSKVLMQAK